MESILDSGFISQVITVDANQPQTLAAPDASAAAEFCKLMKTVNVEHKAELEHEEKIIEEIILKESQADLEASSLIKELEQRNK